jgi:hypothetical protein
MAPPQHLVEGGGFEPPKAEPADLQSAPFGRSGTPPKDKPRIVLIGMGIVNRKTAQIVEIWAILKCAGKIGARKSDAAASDFFGHRPICGHLDEPAQLVKRNWTTYQVTLGNIATGMLQEP